MFSFPDPLNNSIEANQEEGFLGDQTANKIGDIYRESISFGRFGNHIIGLSIFPSQPLNKKN